MTDTTQPIHPFAVNIEKCPANDWQLTTKGPEPFTSQDETPFTLIDSEELLDTLVTKLKEVKEIAVAYKRDTYLSFKGVNCIIQISTRTEDFLVDTITLKDKVQILNEILTDMGILKVMHLMEHNMELLQKDSGLYVVNMFDLNVAESMIRKNATDHSEKGLKPGDISIRGLLKQYCSLEIKAFQNPSSKWRTRPLSAELIANGRQEVHYLLHVYDKQRNSLIKMDNLKNLYERCNDICKVVWYTGKDQLSKQPNLKGDSTPTQLEVFRVLNEWRTAIAEEHDVGISYVLPLRLLTRISRNVPADVEGIKKVCAPATVGPLLEKNLEVVLELILKAVKDVPREKLGKAPKKNFGNHQSYPYRRPSFRPTFRPSIRPSFPHYRFSGGGFAGRGPMLHPLMRPMGPVMAPMGPMAHMRRRGPWGVPPP